MTRYQTLQIQWLNLMQRMSAAREQGQKEEYYRLDAEINGLELEIQKELKERK